MLATNVFRQRRHKCYNFEMKKFEIIIFDIDGTLTRSKQSLESEMAELISQLLKKYKVAIISGASYKQFEWQILASLNCDSEELKNLYLLPVDGTVLCVYQGGWQCKDSETLSTDEKEMIKKAFENVFEKSGLDKPEKIYGELIEDRGAQLNFSALGQNAPIEFKESWDPLNTKREKVILALKQILPNFSMRIGGTTSIEITKTDIDKGYGIERLARELSIPKEEMLYVGDKIFKGGNDEPALRLGLQYKAVKNLEETKEVITELLKLKEVL